MYRRKKRRRGLLKVENSEAHALQLLKEREIPSRSPAKLHVFQEIPHGDIVLDNLHFTTN
jgi:hypothetical protein